jgi:Mce-associated membrane protein
MEGRAGRPRRREELSTPVAQRRRPADRALAVQIISEQWADDLPPAHPADTAPIPRIPVPEAEPAAEGPAPQRSTSATSRVVPLVVLLLVAAIALGAAAYFRGQAARASTGAVDNRALVDPTATAEVLGQVSNAIEVVLSYDFSRLDDNERAGRDVTTGRYAQEYAATFAEVRRIAPQRRLVLTSTVPLAGVTRLSGDRAELIAAVDHAATSASAPLRSTGRLKVVAARADGRWKIAEMTLL